MSHDDRKPPQKTETLHLRIGQPFNPYKLFNGIFIPEELVRYRGLGCGAKVAYGRLTRYAGENGDCWPSIPTLAAEIGMGPTQARIYVHELEKKRFIAIEQRPGTSGRYTFLWHEAFAGEIGDKRKTHPSGKAEGYGLGRPQAHPCGKPHHQPCGKPETKIVIIKRVRLKRVTVKRVRFRTPTKKRSAANLCFVLMMMKTPERPTLLILLGRSCAPSIGLLMAAGR
jgi:hypothetical protein